jgi:glycosyltransferase involved in cell wall biosynthesis
VKLGFDAKRLFHNFTGLGNYSRFVVKALNDYYPEDEYVLYSGKFKSVADTEYFFHQKNIQLTSPSGIQAKFKSVWRSYQLGNVAAADGVNLFHGLSNELPITKPHGLKTVVTIHDVIFKRYPEFYKPIDRLIYDFKFKKACSGADKIIAVSQQTANDVIDYLKADPKKVEVVYQGCHPVFKKQYTAEEIEKVKLKYQLPDRFILNVGTIESRKNAKLVVNALSQIKESIQLVIVGRSTPYTAEVNQLVKEKGLSHQVKLIHHAEFLDLPLIYRAANLFVYPSLFEGFGIPIVEAIASGLPVITSTGSCFIEAGGADCWYVDPSKADNLAAVIQQVWRGGDDIKQRVENSRQYIQRFEPKVIADELMRVYKSIV